MLATQNPIELEGTYPLPEAELDRFFFKLHVGFPSRAELGEIVDRTTGPTRRAAVRAVADGATRARAAGAGARDPGRLHVADYAVRLVLASHPELPEAAETARRNVRFGASPRAAQAIILASKIHAVLAGRVTSRSTTCAASRCPPCAIG